MSLHALAAEADKTIQYKSPPVGTKLIYGPLKDSISVTEIDGNATTYESSKVDPYTRYGNIVQITGDPYSPFHGNIETELSDDNKKLVDAFWPLKVGNKITYKIEENWPPRYWQVWSLTSVVDSIGPLYVGGKFYASVKIVTKGLSVENCACSTWAEEGRKFVETVWLHPDTGVMLKFERTWSGKEATYGHPNGHFEQMILEQVKFPTGSKLVIRPLNKDELKPEYNLVSAEKARKTDEAKRRALRQRLETIRLAKIQRKKEADAERKRLAEIERTRLAALELNKAKQSASAIGGANILKQQLASLHQLRANGLINEQDFASKKKALLTWFLGLKPPSTTQTVAPHPQHANVNRETTIELNLAKYADVQFGAYHALIIGSNNYKHLRKLKTAKTDAESIADVLRTFYGFKVKLLTDASRDNILDALDEYREKLTSADNLLIYYAGHGWLDKGSDRGYWLPVDAKANRRRDWLSTVDVTDTLKALNAKHVLVMADSCYSGTLVRGIKVQAHMPDYVRKVAKKRARLVMTSGGLEPVVDSAGGNHSPFASTFLNLLRTNKGVMDGTNMFSKLRRPVMLKADQTPEYADVRKAGHEGGDFLFVRRR
jgi:hypothetical protein